MNQLHEHEVEFRSSNEWLRKESEESVLHEKRKVTTRFKVTWAGSNTWKQDVNPIILAPNQEHLKTNRTIPLMRRS